MECSNTSSQIYGKMEKWRNGMFHYYFPNLWKMEKWRNGMFRYYFPDLWRKSDFDQKIFSAEIAFGQKIGT